MTAPTAAPLPLPERLIARADHHFHRGSLTDCELLREAAAEIRMAADNNMAGHNNDRAQACEEAAAALAQRSEIATEFPADVTRWARNCEAAIERATLAAKVSGRTSETREEADRVAQWARDAETEAQETVSAAIRYAWHAGSLAQRDDGRAVVSTLRDELRSCMTWIDDVIDAGSARAHFEAVLRRADESLT